jgi:DNA-binding LacI/PurR family transcriptional regulator/AraC-like DNA-binding protein/signal transduction histidine kinase
MVREARRRNVRLLIFPGGRLGSGRVEDRERLFVYDLIGPEGADGLISWASSLGGTAGEEELQRFHERWASLPMVSIAQRVGSSPLVRIDAYGGMRALMSHLLGQHGIHAPAFIRGPEAHVSAGERLQAYRDALREADLDERPELVTPPLAWDEGRRGVDILCEERGLRPGRDFDALMASSDLQAFDAIHHLNALGFAVPDDLALTGFNDSEESRLTYPPLTTVRMPFDSQGAEAFKLILDRLEGRTIGDPPPLMPELLTRRSCGCFSETLNLASPVGQAASAGDLAAEMVRAAGLAGDDCPGWTEAVARSWTELIAGQCRLEDFLGALDRSLDRALHSGFDPGPWQAAVSVLRRAKGGAEGKAERRRAEEAADAARILISEAASRALTLHQWKESRKSRILREMDYGFMAASSMDELGSVLGRAAIDLDIPSVRLALLEEDGSRASLAAAWPEAPDALGRPFPARALLPPGMTEGSGGFVVEPIAGAPGVRGYLILEIGPEEGGVYEDLRDSVSAALRSLALLEENRAARQAAEKAQAIKTRLLANVTRELREPLLSIVEFAEAMGRGGAPLRALAKRQLEMTDDLLDLSLADIDELDMRRRVVNPLTDILAPALDPDPIPMTPLPLIVADSGRLVTALARLADYLRARSDGQAPRVNVSLRPPRLAVSLEGAGEPLDQAERESLFEAFSDPEGRREGMGLSLALARHVIALHGGLVSARPGAGGSGIVIEVLLPLPTLSGHDPIPDDPSARPFEIKAGADADALAAGGAACLVWHLDQAEPADWIVLSDITSRASILAMRAPLACYPDPAGKRGEPERFEHIRDYLESIDPCGEIPAIVFYREQPQVRASDAHPSTFSAGGRSHPLLRLEGPQALMRLSAGPPPALVRAIIHGPLPDFLESLDRILGPAWKGEARRLPVLAELETPLSLSQAEAVGQRPDLVTLDEGILSEEELKAIAVRLLDPQACLPAPTGLIVKRAVAALNAGFAAGITRWKLAEAVNASEDYLSRVFRRETGLSPWEYLNRVRLKHAARLLAGTDKSVGAIAHECGFQDQAYFCRVFVKRFGVSPIRYRRAAE